MEIFLNNVTVDFLFNNCLAYNLTPEVIRTSNTGLNKYFMLMGIISEVSFVFITLNIRLKQNVSILDYVYFSCDCNKKEKIFWLFIL